MAATGEIPARSVLDEAVIRCATPECRALLRREESVPHPDGSAHVELYCCPDCRRKAVVIFELAGDLTADQRSWVEREVRLRGSFFPGDYTGGPGRFER